MLRTGEEVWYLSMFTKILETITACCNVFAGSSIVAFPPGQADSIFNVPLFIAKSDLYTRSFLISDHWR